MIKVDADLCLGCLSCSNVCPSQNIVRTETEEMRIIHWKKCKEECDLCVEFCPGHALTLVPFDESAPESEVSFELVACKICKSCYATEPMLRRIESSLPANMQKDSEGLNGSGSVLYAGAILRRRGLPGRWCWQGAERAREGKGRKR
ncbi:MAG: 4Fe-4S dicluster domain-containing protein [Methanothrix sp.]|jgi:Pyruvate/2-oxoacid:ferredoxin oxidoreductase delta subunit|nr:4Fe-4S dicluster domain-containing protein [Methanothrix sp.]